MRRKDFFFSFLLESQDTQLGSERWVDNNGEVSRVLQGREDKDSVVGGILLSVLACFFEDWVVGLGWGRAGSEIQC